MSDLEDYEARMCREEEAEEKAEAEELLEAEIERLMECEYKDMANLIIHTDLNEEFFILKAEYLVDRTFAEKVCVYRVWTRSKGFPSYIKGDMVGLLAKGKENI